MARTATGHARHASGPLAAVAEPTPARSRPDVTSAGYDLTRHRWLARWLRAPSWQFQLIVPNQILFWVVIVVGLVGTSDPELNFATAITWYVWFCLVFVLVLTTGRGWCAVCPFGGLAEWIQRRSLWHSAADRRPLGLGLPFPERLARYGYVLPVATFALLTWIEEFFEIAGPGDPPLTSAMVVGIIVVAVVTFLVFERRTFCRYLCPLSSVIGVLGAQAPLAGFRARDRQVCLDCETKDCLRGNESGYGCPWFNWPGSAETNLNCGLCGECYRSCPSANVGLYVGRPLAGVIRPGRRRADVAWSVAGLAAIVVYQQLNATAGYTALDDELNRLTHLPHYPNPIAYLGVIGVLVLLVAAPAWLAGHSLVRPEAVPPGGGDSFVYRRTPFRAVFLPSMYAAVPLVGADYLARQLPKFMDNAAKVIPAAGHLLGFGSGAGSALSNVTMGPAGAVVAAQLVTVALGTGASLYAAYRIGQVELAPVLRVPVIARAGLPALVIAGGVLMGWLYVLIQAAE
jgi:NosR/NirI family nitrous oxide reductase transcriptional regulator